MAIGGQERGRERVEVRNSRRPETGLGETLRSSICRP